MEQEEIMKLCQETGDEQYAKFLMDEGWKYDTENEALAGYQRKVKSVTGTLLTFEEFLEELRDYDNVELLRKLYHTLHGYVEQGILRPLCVYQYAKFRWCLKKPEAAIACQIGRDCWAVNNCAEAISEERAKLLINSEFGFEASRIKLLGIPYYDATDWNFICFHCGAYDWLMRDGELHRIYQ